MSERKDKLKESIAKYIERANWNPRVVGRMIEKYEGFTEWKAATTEEENTIIRNSAEASRTTLSSMLSKNRDRVNVIARSIAYNELREMGYPDRRIAAIFGRDRSTIFCAMDVFKRDVEYKAEDLLLAIEEYKKLSENL